MHLESLGRKEKWVLPGEEVLLVCLELGERWDHLDQPDQMETKDPLE